MYGLISFMSTWVRMFLSRSEGRKCVEKFLIAPKEHEDKNTNNIDNMYKEV